MKNTITVLLFAFALITVVRAVDEQNDTVLFAASDYRFVVTSCKVETLEKQKKRVYLAVSYEVPRDARFTLYITLSRTEPMVDAFSIQELKKTPKGEAKFEFLSDGEISEFYVGLWRGVGGGSPSGVVCDGAIVNLPLKITPVFRHEK